jgi:hypothetical protein
LIANKTNNNQYKVTKQTLEKLSKMSEDYEQFRIIDEIEIKQEIVLDPNE